MQKKDIDFGTIQRHFSGDRFAELCGIKIVETGPGYARTRLQVKDHHLNSLDMVHGGAVFTLADQAFAAAVHTRGNVAVAISISISYIKAGRGRVLFAEAREVSRTPRLATYTITVTDEAEDIIASLQGLAYVKNESLVME